MNRQRQVYEMHAAGAKENCFLITTICTPLSDNDIYSIAMHESIPKPNKNQPLLSTRPKFRNRIRHLDS